MVDRAPPRRVFDPRRDLIYTPPVHEPNHSNHFTEAEAEEEMTDELMAELDALAQDMPAAPVIVAREIHPDDVDLTPAQAILKYRI